MPPCQSIDRTFSGNTNGLYFSLKLTFLLPQVGQVTPFGQRRTTRYSRQLAGSEVYAASWRVFGSAAIINIRPRSSFCQLYYCPNQPVAEAASLRSLFRNPLILYR